MVSHIKSLILALKFDGVFIGLIFFTNAITFFAAADFRAQDRQVLYPVESSYSTTKHGSKKITLGAHFIVMLVNQKLIKW